VGHAPGGSAAATDFLMSRIVRLFVLCISRFHVEERHRQLIFLTLFDHPEKLNAGGPPNPLGETVFALS
jgi:hypothetical protein